jgi:hypothetical protein
VITESSNEDFQTIDLTVLSANAYALFYKASIQQSDVAIADSGDARTTCRLVVDGSAVDESTIDPHDTVNVLVGATGGGYPISAETTFTLQAAVPATGSPVQVTVDCHLSSSGSTASSVVNRGQLIAIALGSLTVVAAP